MTFEVIGFASGEDDLRYQQDIPLSREELTVIMPWKEEGDWVYDWRLTEHQIIEIQKLCPFQLPVDLDLYLSCYQ